MNYGVVGIGRWGQIVAKTLHKMNCLHSVASNGNVKNLKKIKEEIQDINCISIDQMFSSNDVDIVFVCVPHEFLYDVAMLALNAKKHVIIEKPGALRLEDLNSLEIKRAEVERTCYVNYMYATDPALDIAKELTSCNIITNMNFFWEKRGSFDNDILMNLLTHDFSIIRKFDMSDMRIHSKSLERDRVSLELSTDKIKNCQILIDRNSVNKTKKIEIETQKKFLTVVDHQLSINGKKVYDSPVSPLEDHIIRLNQKVSESITNLPLAIKILQDVMKTRAT